MTREEAIQELQNCIGLIQQDGQDYLDERDIPLLNMAIEALSERNIAREIATILENEQDMRVMLQNGEVVRCKDCRWYENRYGEVCHNPRYGDGHANYSPPYVDGEYFCKDGERGEP